MEQLVNTAQDVLERALETHGGRARWDEVQRLDLTWTFHGLMFKMRLREGQLHDLGAHISTQRPHVEIDGYLTKGSTSTFDPTSVEIRALARASRTLSDPRASFGIRSLLWWNDCQMAYFAGYVLWNYAQLPFLLTHPGVTLLGTASHKERGELWTRVDAEFAPGLPTHSRYQQFYVDEVGLLRRHDYHVAVMGGFARGARYIRSYADVDGFKLPSRIEIKLRGPGKSYFKRPSLGFVDLDDISLSRAPER